MRDFTIQDVTAETIADHVVGLSDVLHAAVHNGASVSFILPFSIEDSLGFWHTKVAPSVISGGRVLLAAIANDRVAGTVQLDVDLPPNQAHRGEVAKLLVHPDFCKQGIARALMVHLEHRARDLGKSLITLDTRTGDKAEPLYLSLGYRIAGTIPNFARAPETPDRLDATTYMYKLL
jgi:ribosomal protein S18 acetylase RimI-like enzyme